MTLLFLYFEFFKIGLFAVGGGFATLPFLFEMADRYEWLNSESIGNFLAIAQSSPGPIGINMAAQAAFQYGGIPGALLAALGMVSPAIIVITLIARVMQSFRENKIVISVFSSLRPAAAGLLAAAAFIVLRLALYNDNAAAWHEILRWKEFIMFAVLFFLIYKLKGHPVIYVAVGAIAGILFKL